MKECIIILFVISLYFIISTLILQKVNLTSKTIIDELFHLPQGLAYCNYDFFKWDPKITTLPGLYFVSTLLCAPFGKCDVTCLRFTNVLAGSVNFFLFISLRRVFRPKETIYKSILTATNIAILPPLFFFNHVYYTDVLSVTAVMSLLYFGLTGRYFLASLFGFLSFVIRQTNIIYVLFVMGLRLIGLVYNNLFGRKRLTDNEINVTQQELLRLVKLIINSPMTVLKNQKNAFRLVVELGCYLSVLLTFFIFIILNGSIVVGDKQAHVAVLHLMQISYFCLFTMAFSWPHFLSFINEFVKVSIRYCYISVPILCIIMLLVQANTIVHPYLLADNRHYVFYVWRYFFNSPEMRIVWSPVYLFGGYTVLRSAYDSLDVRFIISFIPTVMLVLCLQGLIELRYFFIPYILLRLFSKSTSYRVLVIEFIYHLIINAATLKIFFNKEIYWDDFKDTQRLIW